MCQFSRPVVSVGSRRVIPAPASKAFDKGRQQETKNQWDKAQESFEKAVQLDPGIFERTSHTGIAAQMASPEDRAHYDFVLAKLYAKMGDHDHSLEFLRKSMEEGYKDFKDVYKDEEFAVLRKDKRFAELVAAKSPALPE